MVGRVRWAATPDQRPDHDQYRHHRRARDAGQVIRAADAGADIVRVSTPDEASTRALREICRESPVPSSPTSISTTAAPSRAAEAGAACLRINPGNIGDAARVREVIRAARDHGCSIRIGVNAGSLEKHLLENTANPVPTRWWNPASTISRSFRTTIFTTSRSA